MNIAKLLNLLKPKPKPRPIYVGDIIVGYDDGLPNSIKIDRTSLGKALTTYGTDSYGYFEELLSFGLASHYGDVYYFNKRQMADASITAYMGNVAGVSTGGAYISARKRRAPWVTPRTGDGYWHCIETARATDDLGLYKAYGGVNTRLGGWATDISGDAGTTMLDLCTKGTTIESWTQPWAWNMDVRPHMRPSDTGTLRIQVTDTAIPDGCFGAATWFTRYGAFTTGVSYWPNAWTAYGVVMLRPPSASPALEPLAYFEMPVEFFDLPEVDEYGNVNITRQYYGIKLPEEIVTIEKPIPSKVLEKKVEILKAKGWTTEEIKAFMPEAYPVERINRLAMSYSALIPSDKSGRPVHGTAIVRIFPSSPEYVYPIERRIQALKEMRGVRQLTREEAIDLALKMDDKLHIHDLVPCTKHDLGGKCFQEYRDWRIYTVGDKPEFADTDIRKHYVKEAKGW